MTALARISLPDPDKTSREVVLDDGGEHADRVHLLTTVEIHAVNAAMAAGRPLLVCGETGTGKTQLARAAARALGRAFVQHVVDSHTESRDLMWTFDTVRRLADAQLAASLHQDPEQVRRDLAVENYLTPGPLWWAFDWPSAVTQSARARTARPDLASGEDPANGCVLLIDEIDKAESDVPNGLLEALGARRFTPLGHTEPVRVTGPMPLVVITSNEERALPDAFLRRCLVLWLSLPEEEQALTEFLIDRGRAHFAAAYRVTDEVLRQAASMLCEDRRKAVTAQTRPLPGQAEYLDLLRAVLRLAPDNPEEQSRMLNVVARYTLRKQTGVGPGQ